MRGDLPNDLFAGQPELTPPVIRPFSEVRSVLASQLADEKAQNLIVDKFEKIKKDVLDPFFDEYQDGAGPPGGSQEAGHVGPRTAAARRPQGGGRSARSSTTS